MARNLTRNTKVYISSQGTLGSCTALNTWEVKVLDGYNFSQATTTEDITIDEAGTSPIRGQKTFNVAVEPVDVALTTYIRPYDNAGSLVDAPERILWGSLSSSSHVIDGSGHHTITTPGNGNGVEQAAGVMTVDFEESDANELAKLYIWFHLENSTYRVDEVNISSAEIDFSISDIATIAWSGMGTALAELSAADHAVIAAWTAGVSAGQDYRAVPATSSTSFLRNKLSSISLQNTEVGTPTIATAVATGGSSNTLIDTGETFSGIEGDYVRYSDDSYVTWETRVILSVASDTITIEGTWSTAPTTGDYEIYAAADKAGQDYTLAITGGNLTIENNMNFLTPEELGVVNQPLPGFAQSRAVSGNITAYLDTGFYGTAALLKDLIENINFVTNAYNFILSIGGAVTALQRVDLTLGTAQLAIPTVNVEDVIATDITFAGQGSGGAIEAQDEIVVTYYAN